MNLQFFLVPVIAAAVSCATFVQAANVLHKPHIYLDSAPTTESVILTVSPAAAWTATSNDSWLTLQAGSFSGSSSQLIKFTVGSNTFGNTRTGTITIAGQTLTVTQASRDYAFATKPVVLGGGQVHEFNPPGGLALTPTGEIWVSLNTAFGAGIKKWSPATNTFSSELAFGEINHGRGVALDAAGDVYIAQDKAIKKYTVATNTIADLVSSTSLYPRSTGIAFDSAGDIWVTVGAPSNKLKKRTSAGVLSDIANLNGFPGGVAIDALGNVYAADSDGSSNRIRCFPGGSSTGTVIASGLLEYYIERASALAVDGSGHVYMTVRDTILRWNAATGTLSEVIGPTLLEPRALASDAAGNLYVGETSFGSYNVSAVPRVLVVTTDIAIPATAGSLGIPPPIPSSATDLAPFQWTSDSAWLTTSIDSGNFNYTWTASETPRYAYLSIAGQKIYVQQGTPVAPTVTTPTATAETTTGTLGGTITNDGGTFITQTGIVFAPTADNANPEIGGTGVGSFPAPLTQAGSFSQSISGLVPNTHYSFKAYATNNSGTGYSAVGTFVTSNLEQPLAFYIPVTATAAQKDGTLLVAGDSSGSTVLRRFDSIGNLDYSFTADASGSIDSILSLENGQVLIGGVFSSLTLEIYSIPTTATRSNIALLNANGTLAASFNASTNGQITSMAVQNDGSIVIGGSFTQVNGVPRNRLARLYASGLLDLTFNPNLNGTVRALAIQANGSIIVGGEFTQVGAAVRNRIVRLTPAGAIDTTFLTSADNVVRCVQFLPSGKMLIGGDFTQINGIARTSLAKLNANGSLDSSLELPISGSVYTIALQADGKYFLGGNFTSVDDNTRRGLAKINAEDSLNFIYSADIDSGTRVNTLTLLPDGRVVMGGSFLMVGGSAAPNLARLVNEAATQTLSPVSTNRIEWLRADAAPEIGDAMFELTTNSGTTWSPLGKGTRIPGGWALTTTTALPATGKLRASGRMHSGSWTAFEAAANYSLTAPEIDVVYNNSSFGSLGLKVPFVTTFTITNTGGLPLTGITAVMSGTDAPMFKIVTPPATTVLGGGSTNVILQTTLTSLSPKTATIRITSNDADENPTEITLTANGVAAVIPVATTLAATNINHESATLNGTVDDKGSPRTVFFDYGVTNKYGQVLTSTTSNGVVSAPATGLRPHTTYHFRVRAESGLGGKPGANKTFITSNRAPFADDDVANSLPSAVTTIDVLHNDSDPDGDRLILTGKPIVDPPTAGKAAYVNNQLVFTAASNFAGTATVTYAISDGFKGTDTGSVTINLGTRSLVPISKSVSALGQAYVLNVTANGPWTVGKTLPWIGISQMQGTGNTPLTVTVQPNNSANSRNGQVTISGITHNLTQAAALAPAISAPGNQVNTILGERFSAAFTSSNGQPVVYKLVSGRLPPGLVMNFNTGVISGIAATSGSYPITVSGKNVIASAPANASTTIIVNPLPTGVVGSFQGYAGRSASARIGREPNLGGRFEMTVTANGVVSGSITEGVTRSSFKGGKMVSTNGSPSSHSLTVSLAGTPMFLDIAFDSATNSASGWLRNVSGLQAVPITAWRTGKTTTYSALHTFRLTNNDVGNGPQGWGYGSASLDGPKGTLLVSGRLQDGSAFTGSAGLGHQSGEFLIYQSLHGNRGSCFGKLTITEGATPPAGNTVTGTLSWQKPASLPVAKDITYAAGFGPFSLAAEGSHYIAPASGGFLMPDTSQFSFTGGGLAADFTQDISVASLGGNINLFTPDNPITNSVAMPKNIDITKGTFEGTFSVGARPATWFGQIVRIGTTTEGYGFFLLPNATPATFRLSGGVKLVP